MRNYDTRANNIDIKMYEAASEVQQLANKVTHCVDQANRAISMTNTFDEMKLDSKNFELVRLNLQEQIDKAFASLDLKETSIKMLEAFIDRYVPVRILI